MSDILDSDGRTMHAPGLHQRSLVLCLFAGTFVMAGLNAAETVWFGGTQRILPIKLAKWKEDGIHSLWGVDNHGRGLWDFNLGTDVAMFDRKADRTHQIIGGRFGIASRFEFGSESFDLWSADFRGGGVYGIAVGPMAYEVSLDHESSHLGDEILDRGDRERVNASVNAIQWTVSRSWPYGIRTYGGVILVPIAEPSALESVGFELGVEVKGIWPADRGYAALDFEIWGYRGWNPDVTLQLGVFIGPREDKTWLSTARVFLQGYAGRVRFGQFYDETEATLQAGVALDW